MEQKQYNSYTKIRLTAQLDGKLRGQIADVWFRAQLAPQPSIEGINNGRVLFLMLEKGDGTIAHYDSRQNSKGWNTEIPANDVPLVEELLRALEVMPVSDSEY